VIIIELFFALAVSLFLTLVFAVIGRQAKSRRRVSLFFLIVFLGAWAGGVWLSPIGPTLLGVYWLAFFAVGLIFALILEAVAAFAALPPDKVSASANDEQTDKKEEKDIESVLGVFFWILLLAFLSAIVLGYFRRLHL
jgi:hypothetical protein